MGRSGGTAPSLSPVNFGASPSSRREEKVEEGKMMNCVQK